MKTKKKFGIMPVASDYRMQAFYWRNANPAYFDTALPFLLQLDDEYEDAVDEEEEQEPTLIKKEIHMDTGTDFGILLLFLVFGQIF